MTIDQQLWQDYNEIKSHLKVLSKVVLEENRSAALAFAIQTEGIINSIEFRRTQLINWKYNVYVCDPDRGDFPQKYVGEFKNGDSQIVYSGQIREIRYVNETDNGVQIQLYSKNTISA